MTSTGGEDTEVHLFYATAGDAVCSSLDGQRKDPSQSPVSSAVTERTQATACMKETEDAQTRSASLEEGRWRAPLASFEGGRGPR